MSSSQSDDLPRTLLGIPCDVHHQFEPGISIERQEFLEQLGTEVGLLPNQDTRPDKVQFVSADENPRLRQSEFTSFAPAASIVGRYRWSICHSIRVWGDSLPGLGDIKHARNAFWHCDSLSGRNIVAGLHSDRIAHCFAVLAGTKVGKPAVAGCRVPQVGVLANLCDWRDDSSGLRG